MMKYMMLLCLFAAVCPAVAMHRVAQIMGHMRPHATSSQGVQTNSSATELDHTHARCAYVGNVLNKQHAKLQNAAPRYQKIVLQALEDFEITKFGIAKILVKKMSADEAKDYPGIYATAWSPSHVTPIICLNELMLHGVPDLVVTFIIYHEVAHIALRHTQRRTSTGLQYDQAEQEADELAVRVLFHHKKFDVLDAACKFNWNTRDMQAAYDACRAKQFFAMASDVYGRDIA